MTHTQGKWINQTMGGSEDGRQILCGKLHLATCHYGNGIDVNEATANAKLIAASPELLSALKTLQEVAARTTQNIVAFDWANELDAAIDEARAAIAAAEGRE